MRYLIALFVPWVSFFTMGKVGQGILCLILQFTFIGWPVATIWAFVSIAGYHADKRTNRIVDAIGATAKAQQASMHPRVHLQTRDAAPPPQVLRAVPQNAPRATRATLHALRPEPEQSPNVEPNAPPQPDRIDEPEQEDATVPASLPSRLSPGEKALFAGIVAAALIGGIAISPVVRPIIYAAWQTATIAVASLLHLFDSDTKPSQAEIVFWQSIVGSPNPRDFSEYLAKYPNGQFAGLARNRFVALNTPPPPPPVAVATPAAQTEDEYWASIRNSFRTSDYYWYLRNYPSGQYVDLARYKIQELERAIPGTPPPPLPDPSASAPASPPPPAPAPAPAPVVTTAPLITAEYALNKAKEADGPSESGLREAFRWFHMSADLGNAEAQSSIALRYEWGIGTPMNKTEAMRWYRKAAANGNATAMWSIAIMYEVGRNVPIDYQQAMTWYRKAAALGDGHGYYGIGMLYQQGLGVQQDMEKAGYWLRKAASAGYDGPHE